MCTDRTFVCDFHDNAIRHVGKERRSRQEGVKECQVETASTRSPVRRAAPVGHLAHRSGREVCTFCAASAARNEVQRKVVVCHRREPAVWVLDPWRVVGANECRNNGEQPKGSWKPVPQPSLGVHASETMVVERKKVFVSYLSDIKSGVQLIIKIPV